MFALCHLCKSISLHIFVCVILKQKVFSKNVQLRKLEIQYKITPWGLFLYNFAVKLAHSFKKE